MYNPTLPSLSTRVETDYKFDQLLWSERSQTLFTDGPFSNPITAWNVSSFTKIYDVALHTVGVTQLLELRAVFSNMLMSSSMDDFIVIF